MDAGIEFDVLFGPAYKGIPIAATAAVQLVEQHDVDALVLQTAREARITARGGNLGAARLGAHHAGGRCHHRRHRHPRIHGSDPGQRRLLAGVLIALDRQEKGQGRTLAIQEVERDYGAHIIAIIQMSDLIQYLGREAGRTAGAGGATGRHEGLPRPVRHLSRRAYRAIVEGGARLFWQQTGAVFSSAGVDHVA